jgi:hypothetical protein
VVATKGLREIPAREFSRKFNGGNDLRKFCKRISQVPYRQGVGDDDTME